MRIFKDATGVEWELRANVASFKRVRDLTGISLYAALHPDTLARIADPLTLGEVLYAMCRPQAQERRLDAEAFGERLAGDAVENATRALLEELPDFFPGAQRDALRQVVDATLRAATIHEQNAGAALEQLKKALEKLSATTNATAAPPGTSPN